MTNKEASDILKHIRDGLDEMVALTDKSREAFDAALAALEAERKTGKWIWQTFSKYMCSECGQMTTVDECMEEPMYIYCPYCGAKMSGGEEE